MWGNNAFRFYFLGVIYLYIRPILVSLLLS